MSRMRSDHSLIYLVYCLSGKPRLSATPWRFLLLPRPVDNPGAILVTRLQNDLALPFVYIRRIHVPARLDAETAARLSGRGTWKLGDVNKVSSVELERWLSAVHLEVDFALRVVRGD